jgi:hypothetical protein
MLQNSITVGDGPAELQALQILALSLVEAASRLSPAIKPDTTPGVPLSPEVVVAPLLVAGARALSLGYFAGPETPIEVLALSVRNTFEIWFRLLHLLESDGNRQAWRNEAITDQIQIYEAMLKLQAPSNVKSAIQGEIERIEREAAVRGLSRAKGPLMMSDLVKGKQYKGEYDAFYKLYSKLVHPSAWFVNMPTAVGSEMYHMTLIVNAQVYGWHILKIVEDRFGISSDQCRQIAIAQLQAPRAVIN